jgi:hypothetical protein
MAKIYIVTSGEYSDYNINAIFSTEELAQAFIDSFKARSYCDMCIEDYDLDPNANDIKQKRRPYWVRIDKEGNVDSIEIVDSAIWFGCEIADARISYTYNLQYMNVYCFANDNNHAIKIAGEKRAQILAANLWGVNNF